MNIATFNEIKKLYLSGLSTFQVKDKLKLSFSVREIQRVLAREGLTRSRKLAYELAVKEGRVGRVKKLSTIKRIRMSAMLRYSILKRDNFRCLLCGATAKERLLEVDHIDFNVRNNAPENLRTLCEWCNFGRRRDNDSTS
jgi:hypothetical protein